MGGGTRRCCFSVPVANRKRTRGGHGPPLPRWNKIVEGVGVGAHTWHESIQVAVRLWALELSLETGFKIVRFAPWGAWYEIMSALYWIFTMSYITKKWIGNHPRWWWWVLDVQSLVKKWVLVGLKSLQGVRITLPCIKVQPLERKLSGLQPNW